MRSVRGWTLLAILTASEVAGAGATPSTAFAGEATSASERAAAKEKYRAGAAAYAEGRYHDAVDLFLQANRLAPSAALSFDVARASEKLGERSKALNWYRDYLRRAVKPKDADRIQKRIATLDAELVKKGLQQVTVLSQPSGATVTIDGQPVGVTPWTSDLVLGFHHAALGRKGYEDADRDFVLGRDAARDVYVDLLKSKGVEPTMAPPRTGFRSAPDETGAPAPSSTSAPSSTPAPSSIPAPSSTPHDVRPSKSKASPMVTWGWVTLGAGGAALGGALAFELLRHGSANDANHELTQVGYGEKVDAAKTQQTLSRVLAGVGGALTVTGGALLIVGIGKSKKEPRVDVAVRGTPTSGSLWVSGKF